MILRQPHLSLEDLAGSLAPRLTAFEAESSRLARPYVLALGNVVWLDDAWPEAQLAAAAIQLAQGACRVLCARLAKRDFVLTALSQYVYLLTTEEPAPVRRRVGLRWEERDVPALLQFAATESWPPEVVADARSAAWRLQAEAAAQLSLSDAVMIGLESFPGLRIDELSRLLSCDRGLAASWRETARKNFARTRRGCCAALLKGFGQTPPLRFSAN